MRVKIQEQLFLRNSSQCPCLDILSSNGPVQFIQFVKTLGNIQKNLNNILFYSSTDNVPLPQGGFKISKNWTPKYFSTVSVSHLINRSSSRYLWFIWCLYRHIYPHLHTKNLLYDNGWWIMKTFYLTEVKVNHLQTCMFNSALFLVALR